MAALRAKENGDKSPTLHMDWRNIMGLSPHRVQRYPEVRNAMI